MGCNPKLKVSCQFPIASTCETPDTSASKVISERQKKAFVRSQAAGRGLPAQRFLPAWLAAQSKACSAKSSCETVKTFSQKPPDPEQLLKTVRSCLDGAAMGAKVQA